LRGQAARQGHPLAFAAGEHVHVAVGETFQAGQCQHFGDPRGDGSARLSLHPQAEGDVFCYRAVGKQRVVLEHQYDATTMRG
jgi:hypothetical protein